MIFLKKILVLTALCFAFLFSIAQQSKNKNAEDKYRAVHWTVKEGLAHDQTSCMLKDVFGFLWIGTPNGLSRFDGTTFKNYFYTPRQHGTIVGPKIWGLVEDSLHNVWIGTDKGLSRYDRNADTLSNFLPTPKTATFSTYIIPFWATKDEIYCQETDSLITSYNIHSLQKKILVNLAPADSVTTDLYSKQHFIFDTKSNSIWMGRKSNSEGLLQISLSTLERTSYQLTRGQSMCYDTRRNSIWTNTDQGLFEFNLDDKQARQAASLKELGRRGITGHIGIDLDVSGRVWFYTSFKGILIYDPNDESVHPVFEKDTISQKNVAKTNSCIYCDRDGLTWTGAWLREGVYQVTPFSQVVKSYNKDISNLRGLHTNDIQNIIKGRKGEMWMGTGDDLLVFDIYRDDFAVFHEKDLPGIRGQYLIPIFVDTIHQKAWLLSGRPSLSFYEMDLESKKCRPIIFKDSSGKKISPEFLDEIPVHYKNGFIIAANYNNHQVIFVVNNDSAVAKQVLSFPARTINYDLVNITPVTDHLLFLRRPDVLGNLTYDDEDGKWSRIKSPMDSIPWSIIKYNAEDQSYWVVGLRQLLHYDHDFRLIKEYNIEDGLPHDAIYGLTPDDRGNIWFNTYRSIYQLNVKTGQISILSQKDGLLSADLRDLGEGIAKDDNGNLYFTTAGNVDGFKRINPEKFNSSPSLAYIKSLDIKNFFLPAVAGANNIQQLALKYFQNRINLETATIDFYSQGKNHIRYKLETEGEKTDWQYAPANYTIRYENLSPGKYKLVIQASNAANEFNGPEKILLINISPPLWQTSWFQILTILFVLAMLFGFIQYRSRNLRKRNILLENKVTERTNELNQSLAELKTTQDHLIQSEKMASLGELTSGIAHEIKNPLNFINNFSEINMELISEIEEEQLRTLDENHQVHVDSIIKTLKKNSEKINHHGKRVDGIVKGMLQHSRLGNINKEPVDINSLCDESLKLAFHGFRAKEKTFNASFETRFDPDIPQIKVFAQDFGRVMINLINNAFYAVHEKKKRAQSDSSPDMLQAESLYKPSVIVSTKKNGSKIFITVSDNGMGIPSPIMNKIFQPFFTTKPTGEGTGLGLSMSYDIISKSHGGEIKAKSKEGLGTDFEIILPV